MSCWSNMLDICSNFKIFKTGAMLNNYILAILGLVFSIWTYDILVKVLGIGPDRKSIDYVVLFVIIQSYLVVYLTSAIGFLWGLHIKDFRYIKLWLGVKIFECAFVLYLLTPLSLFVLGLGVYITLSGWNLYKQLLQNEVTCNEQDRNSSLPPYVVPRFPSEHTININ